MTAYPILEHLVTVGPRDRAEAIRALLPEVAVDRFTNFGRPGTNLRLGAERPRVVLGAHHDIDPGTEQGATDNTAAVSVLIALAQDLERTGWPEGLAINFWDFEEPGNGGFATGSSRYARQLVRDRCRPEHVAVCDVFGLGVPFLSDHCDVAAMRTVRASLAAIGLDAKYVRTPGSDDAAFRWEGIRAALLTTLPVHGGKAGWRVMHSPEDRIEMVDRDSLTVCHAGLHAYVAHTLTLDTPDWTRATLSPTLAAEDPAAAERAAPFAAALARLLAVEAPAPDPRWSPPRRTISARSRIIDARTEQGNDTPSDQLDLLSPDFSVEPLTPRSESGKPRIPNMRRRP